MEELLTKIRDLEKQAVTEESHYYVASVLKEAREMLEKQKGIREALAKLVDVDGKEELESMKAGMKMFPIAEKDREAMNGAIDALLGSL